MIKLEHEVLPSFEQLKFIIEGMRNPMNSWEKSDSFTCADVVGGCRECQVYSDEVENDCVHIDNFNGFYFGQADLNLMNKLSAAGADHRKFMRMIPVGIRITAPLYWWKEFETYCVGVLPNPSDVTSNSCSTMHKIHAKRFEMEDFSVEHLINESLKVDVEGKIERLNMQFKIMMECVIRVLNTAREMYLNTGDKKYWWQMIQLLPSSYNQTRNLTLNYEVLAHMYKSRKNHKLDEWREFCQWIKQLPYSELITGGVV